jgi:hypothetical protein
MTHVISLWTDKTIAHLGVRRVWEEKARNNILKTTKTQLFQGLTNHWQMEGKEERKMLALAPALYKNTGCFYYQRFPPRHA